MGGRILITSRRPEFSRLGKTLSIEGLEPNDAVKLLFKLFLNNASPDDVKTKGILLFVQL